MAKYICIHTHLHTYIHILQYINIWGGGGAVFILVRFVVVCVNVYQSH